MISWFLSRYLSLVVFCVCCVMICYCLFGLCVRLNVMMCSYVLFGMCVLCIVCR